MTTATWTTVTWLGLLAGTLTTLAFLPQVLRTWRRRSAADLSFSMLAVFVGGVSLWLAYGWLMDDLPLMIANGVTLALAGTILILKLRFG